MVDVRAEETNQNLQMQGWTYDAVAKLRSKLIDLSRRSPLIVFKHTPRSVSQLRLVDERPDLLFRQLNDGDLGFEPIPGEEESPADERTPEFGIAYERARLTDEAFLAKTNELGDKESDERAWQNAEQSLRARVREQLGLPKISYGKGADVAEIARAHGFDPSYDLKLTDDSEIFAHQEDNNIRVLLTCKELERRLKSINDHATSHLRETGYHTLHLIFGFVQWFEDDQSDREFHAPLLLLPIKLAKDGSLTKQNYRLSLGEDRLEVNVVLIEKARQHWGLELPLLLKGEAPESYFRRLQPILAQKHRLTVRHFVTISTLPPMVLWGDLDPKKWPEGAFSEHRLLPGLIGAAEVLGAGGDSTIIDIDDPVHEARVPALIVDADASQHRAIMDMASGKDMALEGPPGTGKSQTITNMIATALSQGKRVLFVAEKQAALRVVSDRLRALGFGALLLELHGEKANRADIYNGISERLAAHPLLDAKTLSEKRVELKRHRDLLRRYLSLVHLPIGKIGGNAYSLIWREVHLRERFQHEQIKAMEARWAPTNIEDLSRPELTENRSVLAQYSLALQAIDQQQGQERTKWITAKQLDPFDQSKELYIAAEAGRIAGKIAETAARYALLGFELPNPDGDSILEASTQLLSLSPFTCSNEQVVMTALRYRVEVQELLSAQSTWQIQRDRLAKDIENNDEISVSTVKNLSQFISIDQCPETPAAAQIAQKKVEWLCKSLENENQDIKQIILRLSNGSKTSTEQVKKVVEVFAKLGQVKPSVGALFSTHLLDITSDSAIIAALQEASTILAMHKELEAFVHSEAFLRTPIELEQISEKIELASTFSRMFSGQYKAAWRQAAHLCTKTADRLGTSAFLRKLARYLRARKLFFDENKSKLLFPVMQWDGIESDFDSLLAAWLSISQTRGLLATLGEVSILRWWLMADATERQMFSSLCERLLELFAELDKAGFAEVELDNLSNQCAIRSANLKQIIEISRVAGLRSHAVFRYSEGKTIADEILQLHQMRDAFEAQRTQKIFSWADDINESLSLLKKTLTEIDNIRLSSSPIDVFALLFASEKPVYLLSSIVQNAKNLLNEIKDWKSISDELFDKSGISTSEFCKNLNWKKASIALTALGQDSRGASMAADLLKYKAAVSIQNLMPFAEAANLKQVPVDRLDDLYELLVTSALLRSYFGGDGQELKRLGSFSLDAARKSFKKIDKHLHKLEAADIVARRLQDQPPIGIGYGRKADFTDLRLLEHEINLTRSRTPLRDVVYRAGGALNALKPVWMMSPTSVAQFILTSSQKFDLLIIDEASQMRPEFSISCVLRANQLIVVGDANQLPPSDHFQMNNTEENDDEGVGVDDNTESILDLANQRFRAKPRLKWHYRSQHESLIQFSNREFYDRDLVVFPSPMSNSDELLGVKCFYVPSRFPDTVYEASINQREAELVIEKAFGLMLAYPERSIGIVAMNAKQTELLQNEFDRLIFEEDRVRTYIESFSGTINEFFIKNLENVQGDERDIILISTVYGPNKSGVVRQNFGLMNREVGWRRLNVLVTRAKLSCRLITSLRPDDVKVTEKSSRGVIAFKSYLTYAHGGALYQDASGGETDSDFEIFVADALRGGGYEVVYQVGVEKFRIDLGVRHSTCPIGFIAGIECDGAPYHSGLTVRDRDHIRQTILENLGWKIYRVWSTDWFANPARETAKLLAWLENIRDQTVKELNFKEKSYDDENLE